MQIKKLWDTACMFVGPAYVLLVIFRLAATHGVEWTPGRYGMPRTLLAADGLHYPNGEPIQPATLALVRSGYEEEMWLAVLGFWVLIPVLFLWLYRGMERARRQAIERAIDEEKWYRERREAAQRLRRNGNRTYRG